MKKVVEYLKKLRKDDYMHFVVSLLIAFFMSIVLSATLPDGTGYRLTAALIGAVVAVAVGVYKEVFLDEFVSLADLLADVSGAVVGVILSLL